jgi:enoyl-CoA hydratase
MFIALGGCHQAFSSGADIGEVGLKDRAAAYDFVRRGAELVNLIGRLGKPAVAAIGGYALGGGLELALSCTLRIASNRAVFGLPEVRLGIMPGWGGTQRLAQLCGPSRAALLALTGDSIDAATAFAWGLVDQLVEHDALPESVSALCRTIASHRPAAVTGILAAVGIAGDDLAARLEREAQLFGELFMDPDTSVNMKLTKATADKTPSISLPKTNTKRNPAE